MLVNIAKSSYQIIQNVGTKMLFFAYRPKWFLTNLAQIIKLPAFLQVLKCLGCLTNYSYSIGKRTSW